MPEFGRSLAGGGPEGVDSSAYEEQIARLERVVAEKEHALARALLSATEARQQLETSRAETRELRAQLDRAGGRPTPTAMGEGVNRVRTQSHAEAVALKTRWQQVKRDLDHERQMRQADNAAYGAKIAALTRELASAQTQAALPAADPPRSVWARLSVSAVAGALVVCLYVGWMRLPKTTETATSGASSTAESGSARAAEAAQRTQQSSEKATAEWKKRLEGMDPAVCDFQWTGGLPTIFYRGKDSLIAILSRCTQAVENAGVQ